MAERSNPPFFILGVHRSGTTMLRLMLNSHPDLAVPHETDFIHRFHPRLAEYGDLGTRANLERLLDDVAANPFVEAGGLLKDRDAVLAHPIHSYRDLIDSIMTEWARAQGKKRWGEKTPDYSAEIDMLWSLFPDARYIHLIRDGRDVAVSYGTLSWGTRNVAQVARDWQFRATLCHKVGSVLGPERFLEVRYEDLVQDPASALGRICEFLGEPYSDDLLRYHETARQEMPEGSMQWHESSVRPPDPAKLGQWRTRMSVADRIVFEEIAGPTLALFGYELERHAPTLGSRLRRIYYALPRFAPS